MRPGRGLVVGEEDEEEAVWWRVVMVVPIGLGEWDVKFADGKNWLQTDRPGDGRKDTPSYRDAWTHLNKDRRTNLPVFD